MGFGAGDPDVFTHALLDQAQSSIDSRVVDGLYGRK
jgi:hypothetical protein